MRRKFLILSVTGIILIVILTFLFVDTPFYQFSLTVISLDERPLYFYLIICGGILYLLILWCLINKNKND